jgi:superfamily II DNA or RNA helicase
LDFIDLILAGTGKSFDGIPYSFYEKVKLVLPEDHYDFCENPYCIENGPVDLDKIRKHNLVIVNAHKFGDHRNVSIDDLPRSQFDFIIVDEAHHYPAKTWKSIVDYFSDTPALFLTATPYNCGKPILGPTQSSYICYEKQLQDALRENLIRGVDFFGQEGNVKDDDDTQYHVCAVVDV